jgi:hypothetical protein
VIYARVPDEAHPGFAKLAPTAAMSREGLAALLSRRSGD